MNDDTMESALIDVRKSYRLLFGYQQHILSLVKFIGAHYRLNYVGGRPLFSNPATLGKQALDSWSWDWLNMYLYRFNFESVNRRFSVIILSDTGFFDCAETDKQAIQSFRDPDSSETRLYLVAGDVSDQFFEQNSELFSVGFSCGSEKLFEESGTRALILARMLADFESRETTIDKLEDFRQRCDKSNFVITSA